MSGIEIFIFGALGGVVTSVMVMTALLSHLQNLDKRINYVHKKLIELKRTHDIYENY